MTAFEHISALLSFVYALALTHLLTRAGELIIARERVTFSGYRIGKPSASSGKARPLSFANAS